MSFIDSKRSLGDSQTREDELAEQAPIPLSPPPLPPRTRSRAQTELSQTPGLIVTDDSQYFNAGYNNGFLPESPDLVAEEEVPPAYSEFHDQLNIHQTGFDAGAAVTGTTYALRLARGGVCSCD
jgi:hypothetical protein